MAQKIPKTLVYLLVGVLLLNLVQAHFTELIFDEAYYWHYAKHLDWGYFDHPPMVAWMIGAGQLLFSGELGVRFISCLLSVGTIILIWLIIDHPKKNENVFPFFILVFSMTLLNAYGFFTLPDTPLLFFTALFLLVYKRFLKEDGIVNAVILGVVMAALMYSKYHAVLVIVAVLLSNIKLCTQKSAWIAVMVALLCYSPHFYWLYAQDFISIKYHLFERPNGAYNFNKYTLGYFVNLIAIFGFTFPWVYYSLYKTKTNDRFIKALVYLTYGILLFFFISSFNRRVQTQWVIAISIPLGVLVFYYMMENATVKKWILRAGILNIVILLFLRVGLVNESLFPRHYETHGNKKWATELHEKIGDIPAVFENSYRRAPMYAFYSGATTYSLNNVYYRQNQYTIDDTEDLVQHKRVAHLSEHVKADDFLSTEGNGTLLYGSYIDNFESFRKLRCILPSKNFTLDTNEDQTFELYNPYNYNISLSKLRFGIVYLNETKGPIEVNPIAVAQTQGQKETIAANETLNFSFKLPKTEKTPTYFRITISENGLLYGLNGATTKFNTN